MYLPEHFQETDGAKIRTLVEHNPLATLIAHTPEGLTANHVPVLWAGEQEQELIGHIALANNLHELISDSDEVLAVFRAENAYISPNWYPSKQQHHRHVPTWNYSVVHVHGRLVFHHDEATKRSAVARLTRHHEQATNGDTGWRMADAPEDYIQDMLDAIVAFTLRVTRINAKFKLSQNREAADLEGAAAALESAGQTQIAAAMRRGKN